MIKTLMKVVMEVVIQGVTAANTKDTSFNLATHLNSRHQRLDFIYGSERHKQPTLKINK
jgi:hypothetical protein